MSLIGSRSTTLDGLLDNDFFKSVSMDMKTVLDLYHQAALTANEIYRGLWQR